MQVRSVYRAASHAHATGADSESAADLQESGIRAAFAEPLACALCQAAVAERLDVLCARWALVTVRSFSGGAVQGRC